MEVGVGHVDESRGGRWVVCLGRRVVCLRGRVVGVGRKVVGVAFRWSTIRGPSEHWRRWESASVRKVVLAIRKLARMPISTRKCKRQAAFETPGRFGGQRNLGTSHEVGSQGIIPVAPGSLVKGHVGYGGGDEEVLGHIAKQELT